VENSWDKIAFKLAIPTKGEGLKIMLQKMFKYIDFDKV
jgi:hypothetical protein